MSILTFYQIFSYCICPASTIIFFEGLSRLINHLSKIYDKEPSFDLSRIKPDDAILAKVSRAFHQLQQEDNDEYFNEDGTMKLRPIYEALRQELGYNEIRLALVFVA